MRYHDTVYLRIEELVCSEDFDQRLPMPHVGELAASIREVGVIHRPWVRFGSNEVIAGEDRIAAQVLLNVDGVEVDVWEMTDEEVVKVREHENRFRRPHSTAELAQMVARKLETMRPPPMPEPEPEQEKHVGRKKLDKTRAIEEVAEETGRSKDAVRKAAEREAKRAAKAAAKEPEEPKAAPFETWGRVVSPELLDGANEAHRSLTDAACKVQAAMAALTKLQTKAIVHDSLANRLYADLKACAHELRAARPVALCAWCKGQDGMVTQCAACFGLGHLSEGVAGSIPEALKDPRKVMVGGQEQRLPSERPVPLRPYDFMETLPEPTPEQAARIEEAGLAFESMLRSADAYADKLCVDALLEHQKKDDAGERQVQVPDHVVDLDGAVTTEKWTMANGTTIEFSGDDPGPARGSSVVYEPSDDGLDDLFGDVEEVTNG